MNSTLVLLAAGISTRYGRLKQLEPVGPGGEALLDYAVYDGYRTGFRRVVLIIREELEESFRDHRMNRWPRDLNVISHHQRLDDFPGVDPAVLASPAVRAALSRRTKPWGTAHALLTAKAHLADPFVLLNADDFYGPSAFVQAREVVTRLGEGPGPGPAPPTEAGPGTTRGERSPTDASPAELSLMTYTLEDTLSDHGGVSRGVCRVDRDGWLERIQEVLEIQREGGSIRGVTLAGEALELTGSEPISTNFWVFFRGIFSLLEERFPEFLEQIGEVDVSAQPEFLIPSVVNEALAAGQVRVRCYPTSDRFLGITHAADRAWVVDGLRELTEAGRYPRPLWGAGKG